MPKQSQPVAVTQRDIAAYCEVSVMTVSMALRDDCQSLRPETVSRVREAARKLGYDPAQNLAARRLRYTRSDRQVVNQLIGLYFSLRHVQGPYAWRLLHGLGEALDSAGFALLSNWTPREQQPPTALPAIFARGEVDGVLTLSGVAHIDCLVRMLRDEPGFGRRPIVSLMEGLNDCSCVLIDDAGGGHAIMSHLLDLGHREVLCVDFQRWQHIQRRDGFRQACRDRGLDPERCVKLLAYSSDSAEVSKVNLGRALAANPNCHAIFAGNDFTACAIHGWLQAMGLRVPDDISLIGFDDSHVIADSHGANLLTTVHVPLEEIARHGATLLIDQILGRVREDRRVTLPVGLIVRGSTAPSPRHPRSMP